MNSMVEALRRAGIKTSPKEATAHEIQDQVKVERDSSKLVLAPEIEMVYMQFSFASRDRIPVWLWEASHETNEERTERKSRPFPGEHLIQPTPETSASGFVDQLLSSHLLMVNAFEIPRINAKPNAYNKTYYMVRFVFGYKREGLGEYFASLLDTKGAQALRGMVKNSVWRIRAYKNPFYDENGEVIPHKKLLSVNLEVPNEKTPKGELHIKDGWPSIV